MGCDIHLHVEVKVKKNGRWAHYDWEEPYRKIRENAWDAYFKDPLYVGRNYDLFAVLANVRNGYGFAGVKTGDGFVPISLPKGLPDDVSKEVKKKSDDEGSDGHSHSHFTVAELDAYDWGRTTGHRGWVGAEGFAQWKRDGKPGNWSGGVSGGSVRHLSHDEMEEAVAAGKGENAYTLVTWTEPYRDSVGPFLTETLPALKRLGKPGDVRIVFWFDN